MLINGLCKFGACVTLTCVHSDIDHLTRILFLCGKPEQETIDKIISEEVSLESMLPILSERHIDVIITESVFKLKQSYMINDK